VTYSRSWNSLYRLL